MKVGDVVQLKTGGPRMTVEYITPYHYELASCVWFEGTTLRRIDVSVDALKIVDNHIDSLGR